MRLWARLAWPRQQMLVTATLMTPALLVMLLLFLLPMGRLLLLSIQGESGPTLAHYAELLRPVYGRLLGFTFQLALVVTLLCLLLGYPIAYLLAATTGSARRWMMVALLLALWLSILARTYAWIILLQRNGVINGLLQAAGIIGQPLELVYNRFGVYVGMVHILLPFMVITLVPTLRAIDPALPRAARSLGASAPVTFLRVYLPLSAPGVLAGSTLVFTMALGFFVTPAVLGGGHATTIAMVIQDQVQNLIDFPLASATSIVLLAASIATLSVYDRLVGIDRIFGGTR